MRPIRSSTCAKERCSTRIPIRCWMSLSKEWRWWSLTVPKRVCREWLASASRCKLNLLMNRDPLMICKAAELLYSIYMRKHEEEKALYLLLDLVVRNPYLYYTRSIEFLLNQMLSVPKWSEEKQAFERWKSQYHIEGCCSWIEWCLGGFAMECFTRFLPVCLEFQN